VAFLAARKYVRAVEEGQREKGRGKKRGRRDFVARAAGGSSGARKIRHAKLKVGRGRGQEKRGKKGYSPSTSMKNLVVRQLFSQRSRRRREEANV